MFFSFAEDSVVFQCRYARAINVDESMIIDPDTQPEVGRGDLTYTMAITAGALGGTTSVQITPNHSFGNEVGARLAIMLLGSIDQIFILEWYHVMFLMENMIFMLFTPSTMINYAAIIQGKDS